MLLESPSAASSRTSSTLDSIENCVRVVGKAGKKSGRPLVWQNSFAASAAICAIIVYLSAVLAGSQSYYKLRKYTASPLPNNFDVLMAGSSVIAVPLIRYEYPKRDICLVLDRSPILETRKAERFFSALGATHLVVYNGSALGQNILETEQFVRGVIALHKRPRLLVLWVVPGSFLLDPTHIHKRDDPFSELNKRFATFWLTAHEGADYVQMRLAHLTTHLYSRLNVPEQSRAGIKQKIQDHYRNEYYFGKLQKTKLEALTDILKICHYHSIKTLVVSAPLSVSNRSMMGPGVYDRYHRTISEIVHKCQDNRTSEQDDAFIDLGQSPEFIEESDFRDPAHCNENGCPKMLRAIAPHLVQLTNSKNSSDDSTGSERGGTRETKESDAAPCVQGLVFPTNWGKIQLLEVASGFGYLFTSSSNSEYG
jgi:hypothetical protein